MQFAFVRWATSMKYTPEQLSTEVVVSALHVGMLTATALAVTWFANHKNQTGLGWAVLALWFVQSAAFVFVMRKRYGIVAALGFGLIAAGIAFGLYQVVGVNAFDWSGLVKQ